MLEEEISKIIETNLPAQVGNVLRKRLKQADEDKRNVAQLSHAVEGLREKTLELNTKILDQDGHIRAYGELQKREKELAEKDNNMQVTIAHLKLEESEKRAAQLLDVVKLVFKSPVYRKRKVSENDTPIYDPHSMSVQNITRYDDVTECSEEE